MPPAVVAAPRTAWTFTASTAAAVGVAAAAMVATLPGRTHGLGLVTEPLLADLGLGRVPFAALNFWATLIGSAFCLPVGWMIDRLGVRVVLAAVLTHVMSSYLYGVGPMDPLTYAAVSALLASISLLAIYMPARRAARIDPNVALRADT